ncbi:MAG TPA: hypothetical protein VID51_07835 [Solirubrobacterales bacterium]
MQEFEPWKQELFIRAASAPELSKEDAEAVAAMLLGEAQEGMRPRELEREHLPAGGDAEESMVIKKITGLRNVNAIDDGQTLAFEPGGVNVVWGHNGAGKTGYSRVLKKAGRTLHRENVLANVHRPGDGSPRATVAVKIGEVELATELDLDAEAPATLARICIADSHAGEAYLSDETEVDYVPTTLASLTRLAGGLDAVKAVLERRRGRIELPPLDIAAFAEGTGARALVDGLVAETPEGEIEKLSAFGEEEAARQEDLRKEIGEIDAMQAPQLRAAARRDAGEGSRLREDLARVGSALDIEALAQAGERHQELSEARGAAALAAKRFESEPLAEVGSNPWRALWSAAKLYAEHIGQALPAEHDPAHCPLCQQELGPEARARLVSFEQFVTEDVNARLGALQTQAERALSLLPEVGAVRARHEGALGLLAEDDEELAKSIREWLDLAEERLGRLRRSELDGLEPLSEPPNLSSWIEGREAEARRQAEIESGADAAKLRAELVELEARRLLAERREDVLARRRALAEQARYSEAIGKTLTTGVSRKIGSLSEGLIGRELEEALTRQLQALEFRDIEVVPKTRVSRGQTYAALAFKTVEGVPLTAVLSHGEQRRLALAMFLAEMEVRADNSPVVFDDPTSSIDQEGRRRIARSLLKLGEARQVIVFTHELSLVVELQRYASASNGVFAQHVKRIGPTVGHVFPDLPWDGLSPKERRGYLDQELVKLRKQYEKNDEDSYAPKAAHFCMLLRAAFERTVEELILAGVIRRRNDTVSTGLLREVNLDDQVCDLVDRGVDENSPWVHDQPLADGAASPGPDELGEGLAILAELLEVVGKMKSAKRKEKDARKENRRAKIKAVPLIAEPEEEGPDLKSVPDPEPKPDIAPRHEQSEEEESAGPAVD